MNLYELITFIDFLRIVSISYICIILGHFVFVIDVTFNKKLYNQNLTKEQRDEKIKALRKQFTPLMAITFPRLFLNLFVIIYVFSYIWTDFPNILNSLKNVLSF